ncbi:MAG: hypothetical protein IJN78_00970, partial [Clostridia bacterium]|nr:hypothetical protein [Clostridia bacterium]
PERGDVCGADRGVARRGNFSYNIKFPSLLRNEPLSHDFVVPAFSPKTGTLLSASQTFPLTGESPFRGAIVLLIFYFSPTN